METGLLAYSLRAELFEALATARKKAEELGDENLIALTEMALCDAHHFIVRELEACRAVGTPDCPICWRTIDQREECTDPKCMKGLR